jgi:hypothetical protein
MKKKRLIIIGLINLIMLCTLLATVLRSGSLKNMLQSQLAAERFRGQSDMRFAQVSCFFPAGSGININTIRSFRQTVESKLLEASLTEPDNGSFSIDAYSMKGSLTVKGFRGSFTASALGIGGDYFLFHPLILRSGSYIYEDDPANDKVVLDEELAWQLFGSYDVAGMEVDIDGAVYIVAGVVRREKDFASEKAYSENAGIFVPYQMLAGQDEEMFSCYETVLPNPIPDFAKKIVSEGITGMGVEVVQNTGRYSFGKLWSIIKNFGERSMRTSGIIYPYWENAARIVEDYLVLLLICSILLSLFPIACLIFILARVYIKLRGKKKAAADWLDNQKEKLTQRFRNSYHT